MVAGLIPVPAELRREARAGRFRGLTTGHTAGFVQANLAIVPADVASDFVAFCRANARSCPVLAVGTPGGPSLPELGLGIDVRSDLPAYRVCREGSAPEIVPDIAALWRDDLVAVAIGCWFSMEGALLRARVRLRHLDLGIQGLLFRTNRATVPVGRFGGPLVVSMRPFATEQVKTVERVTARFPRVHGAPIHVGDPAALGITDISRPDFGEAMEIQPNEVPMFWGCGLTALAALQGAGLSFFITHAPGAMLVTDRRNDEFEEGTDASRQQ